MFWPSDSENEDDAAHQVPVSEVANNFEQPQPDQTDPREVDGASMYYNEGATENRYPELGQEAMENGWN